MGYTGKGGSIGLIIVLFPLSFNPLMSNKQYKQNKIRINKPKKEIKLVFDEIFKV